MAAAPWSVTAEKGGKARFTNTTGGKAVAITIQGLGTTYNEAVPHPIDQGEHFDLTLDPRATTYRIFWLPSEPPNRQFEWDYTR